MKYNPLLVFTTYNQIDMTRKCLEYACELGYDILVVDDHSTDGTQEYLFQTHTDAICKGERRGLTDSWNQAYKHWKGTDHSHLILCNNDVLIPKGAIEAMLSSHALVVPMTSYAGAGYVSKAQAIDFHVDVRNYDPIQSDDCQKIQNILSRGFKIAASWTGFCMCMNCRIVDYELPDGNLFDSDNVNVGNDDDLAHRVQAHLAIGAFVWHYKGRSFNKQIAGRDDLSRDYK